MAELGVPDRMYRNGNIHVGWTAGYIWLPDYERPRDDSLGRSDHYNEHAPIEGPKRIAEKVAVALLRVFGIDRHRVLCSVFDATQYSESRCRFTRFRNGKSSSLHHIDHRVSTDGRNAYLAVNMERGHGAPKGRNSGTSCRYGIYYVWHEHSP